MSVPLRETKFDADEPAPQVFEPWRPVKWKPAYDIVVSLFCSGMTQVDIARQTGYHKQHVYNILSTPEAEIIKKKFSLAVQNSIAEEIPGKIAKLRKKAYDRLEEVLDNDTLVEKAPFQMFSAATSFLKGIGSLNDGGLVINNNNQTQNNHLAMSDELASELVAALKEANQVKEIHDAEFKLLGVEQGRKD